MMTLSWKTPCEQESTLENRPCEPLFPTIRALVNKFCSPRETVMLRILHINSEFAVVDGKWTNRHKNTRTARLPSVTHRQNWASHKLARNWANASTNFQPNKMIYWIVVVFNMKNLHGKDSTENELCICIKTIYWRIGTFSLAHDLEKAPEGSTQPVVF